MLKIPAGHLNLFSRISVRLRHAGPYLFIPVALVAFSSLVAFRHQPVASLNVTNVDSLQLPAGWPMPPVPADNPITSAKFVLGRQLFYETALSGDLKTSCGSCHQQKFGFSSSRFPQPGAFGNLNNPIRRVPRIVNVAYDSVLFWDGHAQTLEEQVHLAVLGHGDLDLADTDSVFIKLSNNPAYSAMFTQAFGSPAVTLDRIAMAIATFERCLISGNSPYDQYLNGDSSAFSTSAKNGMKLFFDTSKTNCSQCHNNLGLSNAKSPGNMFTDCNYYRTGTFDPPGSGPSGGYGGGGGGGPDSNLDLGRELVTHDSSDIGKFRTPTLRNVALASFFGAEGTVTSLTQVIDNYSNGGDGVILDSLTGKFEIFGNQDSLILPLKLTQSQQNDLLSFLQSLTDSTFTTNPAFADPGAPSIVVDDHIISGNLSIYPNPASSIVSVQCPDLSGTTEASLISSSGVTVWRRSLNADGRPFQLDFTGISNGAYRLELIAGDVTQASNIVLKR